MDVDSSESRRALPDRVYQQFKDLLIERRIAPGERVSIEGAARLLGVSPTPVREALARLEAEGIVTKRSQAGYRIVGLLTLEQLEDLFDMRLLLEPFAARLAATRASEDELDALETIVEAMGEEPSGVGAEDEGQRFAKLDQEFHHLLIAAAGRPLLLDAVRRLHAHLHMFRLTTTVGARAETVAEHERILRALLRRNEELASAAMVTHLQRSRHRHENEPIRNALDPAKPSDADDQTL